MADIFDQLTASEGATTIDGMTVDKQAVSTAASTSTIQSEMADARRYTERNLKDAVQELVKYGLIEAVKKPNLYQVLNSRLDAVADILEPLDLVMRIDDIRGLAFLTVAELAFEGERPDEDEWSHPLVRRQRLNLEQSLLVAILRQYFVAHELEAGVGASNAVVTLDDLLPQIQLYLGDLGSDSREQNRLRILLEKLKAHGIVSEVDKHDQVMLRPIIAHIANPENLTSLLQVFREQADSDRKEQTNHGD
jgi:hypothetical protein